MCCNLPSDLYDIVIIGNGPAAFAAAFVAREAGARVAVAWSGEPLPDELCSTLPQEYDIALAEGQPRRDGADFLYVDDRLIYGEHVVDTIHEHRGVDAAAEAVSEAAKAGLPFRF
jgi:succinate dehydrogenase/fumarate reductase flavoprotein subunit